MEFFLSLVKDAALTITKVVASEMAKQLLARLKGRTAPTANKGGSDSINS